MQATHPGPLPRVPLTFSSLPSQAAEVAYRKAERVLERERREAETAERAVAAAEMKLEK